MARSHTKTGPGRTHGQCRLIADPVTGAHVGVTEPKRRFQIANFGGNWKGREYLSYREHDRISVLMRERFVTRPEAVELMKAERH